MSIARFNIRSRVAQLSLALLPVLAAALPACDNQSAIVLSVRPPPGVTLSQYAVQIQDRETRTIVYQSGVQPIDAVAQGRDLSADPLKVGLKLNKGGTYFIHVRASAAPDKLAPDGVTPSPRTSEYFFASLTTASGTVETDAELLEVQPQFDQDFDHFPDYTTWLPAQGAAQARYGGHPELLDCVDKDPGSGEPALPVSYPAAQINPLAKPVCGLAIDLSCEGTAPVCADKDSDGDPENLDCDDNDPKRFSKNPRPRNCCQCTDRASCATNHAKLADQSVCQPARCDSSFDYDCTGRVVPCFVDDDCDGFSPNDPVTALRDCDDTNAAVYPGAPKNCADPSHDWACDGSPQAGCVPCDLDGDGYQRNDVANACPTANYAKALDCNDNDRGVFPGSTNKANEGVTLIIRDLKDKEGGGSVAAALRGLCRNQAPVFQTTLAPQDADCDGNPRNGCPTAACDADGDGFPNTGGGCNPMGLPVDCDDTDPRTFPGAPERCGDGKAQGCVVDKPCAGLVDQDSDGYSADYDCNDNNAAIHPWGIETCDGVDNDCDGLIDELNPDNTGAPLTKAYSGGVLGVRDCTDDTDGECGKQSAVGAYSGRCVCGTVPPNSTQDPVPGNRVICPGVTATGISPKCYGSTQPKKQTCDADNPRDDDCNGSTSDLTGANLAELGLSCGINQGECRPGTVTGCNRAVQNAFAGLPGVASKDRFLVCGGAGVVTPTTEICDNKDNDCDLSTDESCSLPGGTTPACCSLMCVDTNSDLTHCGNCTTVCSSTAANQCAGGMCRCGANPACTGTTPLCKAGGTCVQCLADANCSTQPTNKACNTTTNTCVQCTANANCTGTPTTPICKTATNSCVQCTASADCSGQATNKACDTTTNSCVQCVTSTDCAGQAVNKACDTTTHQCVRCVGNSDCNSGEQCKTSNHTCVDCVDNGGCSAPTGQCDTATNTCRACVNNADCAGTPTTPICDTVMTHACVGCVANMDCGGTTPKCNVGNHTCVACLMTADCPGTMQCLNNACVQCTMDAHCAMPTPRCDNTTYTCVQCLMSGDCSPATPICSNKSCVECVNNMSCALPSKSRCSSNVCGVCMGAADCTHISGKPQCKTGSGCVECLGSTDCMTAAKPICTADVCGACTNNAQCEARSVNTPRCDTTGGDCEACGTSASCNLDANRPICDTTNGDCEKCTMNAQCDAKSATAPKCDVVNGDCEMCTASLDCDVAAGRPICNTGTGACAACATNTQCDARNVNTPKCDTTNGDCEACGTNASCNFDANRPICDVTMGDCEKCTANLQCDAKSLTSPVCDVTNGDCEKCVTNMQCNVDPMRTVCEPVSGACLQCVMNADCTMDPTKPKCSGGMCTACTANADCTGNPNGNLCDTGTGKCVECLGNTDCTLAAKSQCNAAGDCVECTADASCTHITGKNQCVATLGCVACETASAECTYSAAEPICDTNSCRGCTTNMECEGKSATKPYCDTANGDCEACGTSANCNIAANRPICDTTNGDCQACATNAECRMKNATTPVCMAGGTCEMCTTNMDCDGNPDGNKCNTATGACVPCTMNSECNYDMTKPSCDTVSGTCKPCSATLTCTGSPFGGVCDTGTGKCAACLLSSDCMSATMPICMAMTCNACTAGTTGCYDKNTKEPYCKMDGSCAPCANFASCDFDPNKPICLGTGECDACTVGGMECVGHPKGELCDTGGSGACSCAGFSDCTTANRPFCDTTLTVPACRACTNNAECPATAPNCDTGTGVCS